MIAFIHVIFWIICTLTALAIMFILLIILDNFLCKVFGAKYDIIEYKEPGKIVCYLIEEYFIKMEVLKRYIYIDNNVSEYIKVNDNKVHFGTRNGKLIFPDEYNAKMYLIYMKKFYNDVGSSTKTTLTNDDIEKAAIISDGHA